MKESCEVIKDLLPLYHDGVCSNDSAAMVKNHLAECEDCANELMNMDNKISLTNAVENRSEAESLLKLSLKWRKGMLKSFLKGVLITILAIAAIALILYLFVDIRVFLPS